MAICSRLRTPSRTVKSSSGAAIKAARFTTRTRSGCTPSRRASDRAPRMIGIEISFGERGPRRGRLFGVCLLVLEVFHLQVVEQLFGARQHRGYGVKMVEPLPPNFDYAQLS